MPYRIDIYCLGYYAGKRARKVDSIMPTSVVAQGTLSVVTTLGNNGGAAFSLDVHQ